MDILKRSLAPIVPAAWEEIDEQAALAYARNWLSVELPRAFQPTSPRLQ